MPERLSGSCMEAHQVSVVVSGEDQIAGRRNGPSPHRCGTWHRELPAQLPGCSINGPKIKLPRTGIDDVVSGSSESAICNGLLARAVVELALLQRDNVEQSEFGIERWRPPVGCAVNGGTCQRSCGRRF